MLLPNSEGEEEDISDARGRERRIGNAIERRESVTLVEGRGLIDADHVFEDERLMFTEAYVLMTSSLRGSNERSVT